MHTQGFCSTTDSMEVSGASDLGSIPNKTTKSIKQNEVKVFVFSTLTSFLAKIGFYISISQDCLRDRLDTLLIPFCFDS